MQSSAKCHLPFFLRLCAPFCSRPLAKLFTIYVARSPFSSPLGRLGPLSPSRTNEIEQQNQEQHGAEMETMKNGNLVSYSYATLILVAVYLALKSNPEQTESNGQRS